MSLEKESKINQLLKNWPKETPAQTLWLRELGYSDQLLGKYKKSKWIIPFETGAYKKPQDKITNLGAIHALQYQSGMSIHPAGPTALMLLGKSHYLEMAQKQISLMGEPE